MALSRHDHDVLSHIENDMSTTAPRLARRLASGRHRSVRGVAAQALTIAGWTLAAAGLILLFCFPGVPALVGVSFALMAVGLLTATRVSILEHVTEELKRRRTVGKDANDPSGFPPGGVR